MADHPTSDNNLGLLDCTRGKVRKVSCLTMLVIVETTSSSAREIDCFIYVKILKIGS